MRNANILFFSRDRFLLKYLYTNPTAQSGVQRQGRRRSARDGAGSGRKRRRRRSRVGSSREAGDKGWTKENL